MNEKQEKIIKYIRWSIWLYFVLLLIEGALRKWVLPRFGSALLIVRDPVVIVAYVLAIRARVFPMNRWIFALGVMAVLSFAISFIPLWDYVSPKRILLVALYGMRCDYLHLPLIFLMSTVLRKEDVRRFGWWTLVLLMPMTILMIAQFQSTPDSLLNRTSTGEGDMMLSALGKVRTAATFSFVVGVVAYFALATGFLIWAALRRDVYKIWLLLGAGISLVIGTAVSGSRSVVAACAVVIASLFAVVIVRPSAVNRIGQTLLIVLVAGFIALQTPIFNEGFKVLSTRFNEVAEANDTSVGRSLLDRFFSDFEDGFHVLARAPFLGYGLGVGTNGGSMLLVGQSTFLLSESEWSRVFLESGPVLGLAFIVWRLCLVFRMGLACLGSVVRARNLLPLLLFSTCILPLVNGQFGQNTVLGFAVFAAGLTLAARKEDNLIGSITTASSTPVAPPRPAVARVSPYALRLHGVTEESAADHPDHSNGSVDR